MYSVIGQGIDGIIIHPALVCDPKLDIQYEEYVSKISIHSDHLERTYSIINQLPEDLDGKAYEKKVFLCKIDQEDIPDTLQTNPYIQKVFNHLKNSIRKSGLPNEDDSALVDSNLKKSKKRKVTNQLLMPYIDGMNLENYLFFSIHSRYALKTKEWLKLLNKCIYFYDYIEKLNERHIFHNDIGLSNLMYLSKKKALRLIDFDKITFESPKKIGPVHLFENKTFIDFDEKYAYNSDRKDFIRIIWNVIDVMCNGKEARNIDYDLMKDSYHVGELELEDEESFRKRKALFEKYEIPSHLKKQDLFLQLKLLKQALPLIRKEDSLVNISLSNTKNHTTKKESNSLRKKSRYSRKNESKK